MRRLLISVVLGSMCVGTVLGQTGFNGGRPVVNKTGLNGYYQIKVQFAAGLSAGAPGTTSTAGDLPDIFSALPAQLGLKLEPSKTERDTLVIERMERPTEN